ncbi:MAG TPA: hypothetical protein PLP62_12820 [Flavobacteriaceae bacterium]|nr:hypothetical protein [Flavobacteriaceae bacterium]
MLSLTHIINPVKVTTTSDLYVAQPITFETMKRAKGYVNGRVHVDLVTAQFEEDKEIIPGYFQTTPNLERSVLDIGSFQIPRKLPLLNDILERAYQFNPDADYLIYTNVDIALQPHFYDFVSQQIEKGLDAFVINRRTISKEHSLEGLENAYKDLGEKHPGFDCFVISQAVYSKICLNKVAIGISKVGITLLANLMVFAEHFMLFEEEHLTFHIGADKVWQNPKFHDYFLHNCKEAYKTYQWLQTVNSRIKTNPIFEKHWKLLEMELCQEKPTPQKTTSNLLKRMVKKWR